MNKINILDCTLRDGGYINNWNFGNVSIKKIIENLCSANIEVIECGFLRDTEYNSECSVFSDVGQIATVIGQKKESVMYVAMIALGEISIDSICPKLENSIDGIRLTFHKHQWNEAKQFAIQLMNKGYKVFIQPVGTTSYSDEELLHLINDVNQLNPFAFYLVDTLSIMYRKDLRRLFFLIDNNLNPDICLGFHSHNNLQLSFANAQELMHFDTKRNIIIDTSVYGMGRGVGNLATELLTQYINENVVDKYSILPILSIADKYLLKIYCEHRWGYDLPYFLSAKEHCHPNYASYLMSKETLSVEAISKILSLLPVNERDLYNKQLVEGLYLNYQNCFIDDLATVNELKSVFEDKEVLIIASGNSINERKDVIKNYSTKNKPIIISVNFECKNVTPNYIFISNQKRFIDSIFDKNVKFITTSNLKDLVTNNNYTINYSSYLGCGAAADNAGAMLIRFLKKCGVKTLVLAGFDGFEHNKDNYCVGINSVVSDSKSAFEKNNDISSQLKNALENVSYKLLTPSRYDI